MSIDDDRVPKHLRRNLPRLRRRTLRRRQAGRHHQYRKMSKEKFFHRAAQGSVAGCPSIIRTLARFCQIELKNFCEARKLFSRSTQGRGE